MNYRPETAVWELTTACNANCIHCGSRSGQARKGELTEAQALDLCDQLKTLGCERITLIGGEIFLSPYWEKVAARLTGHGIRVAPLTNGSMLTEENIEKIAAAGIDNVAVSIDGLAKTHDYIRGIPGLFEEAMANLLIAKKKGFFAGVNTSISALNLDELPQLYEYLLANQISGWQIQIVENMGNANENPELELDVEKYYRLAKYIAQFRSQRKMLIRTCHNIGWFTSFEPLLRYRPFTGCAAGRFVVGIESNGNVRGCLSIMADPEVNVEGNVKERSLIDIWNDPEAFKPFRNRTIESLTGFCRNCEYNDLCRGGCSSVAYSLIQKFTENPWCLYKYETENGLKYTPPGFES